VPHLCGSCGRHCRTGAQHDCPYCVRLDHPFIGWRSEWRPDRSSLGSLLTGDRGFGIQRYLRALLGEPSRVQRRCAGLSSNVTWWHGPRSLSSGRVIMGALPVALRGTALRHAPMGRYGFLAAGQLVGGISLNFSQGTLSVFRLSFRAALQDLLLCLQ